MAGKWWQRLIPTYGNWGGPGWCGGQYCNDRSLTDWDVKPIDELDAYYKIHDWQYQTGVSPDQADKFLIKALREIEVTGTWTKLHRLGAIAVFSVRYHLDLYWS